MAICRKKEIGIKIASVIGNNILLKEENTMKKLTIERIDTYLGPIMVSAGRLFLEASLYLDELYGLDGRMIIRKATRALGEWRGHQARKAYYAVGLPFDASSLMYNWDSAAASKLNREVWDKEPEKYVFSPGYTNVPNDDFDGMCSISKSWRESGQWLLGHIYCDEYHMSFAHAFNPAITLAITECCMKGDTRCNFHLSMDPNAPLPPRLPLYDGEDPKSDWGSAPGLEGALADLRRETRNYLARFYTLLVAIRNVHPENYAELFEVILDRWSSHRAEDLKERAKKENLLCTPETFLEIADNCYPGAWNMETNTRGQELEVTVHYCPFAETWRWMEDPKDMKSFCKHMCGSSAEKFSGCKAEIKGTLADGCDACKILYKYEGK